MIVNFLKNCISARMFNQKIKNDDELYVYMLSYAALFFCIIIHLYLLIIYAIAGEMTFVLINIISELLYLALFFMIKAGKYTIVGLLLSLEVIAYTAITSYFFGLSMYIGGYYLLVVVMQLVFPYSNKKIRSIVVAISVAAATLSIFFDVLSPPIFFLTPSIEKLLMISNIYLLIMGIFIELSIVNLLKGIINKLNQFRLDELSTQAHTDPLTGLCNRRYADLFFGKIKHSKNDYAVAIVDIDDFKNINDAYGHNCGDYILVFVAGFMKKNLRSSDILFRWGGDEFLVVLFDVDMDSAINILNKARKRLSGLDILTPKGKVKVTVTIGVSKFELNTPFESINNSDMRLYEGKSKGKNIVIG